MLGTSPGRHPMTSYTTPTRFMLTPVGCVEAISLSGCLPVRPTSTYRCKWPTVDLPYLASRLPLKL